MHNHVPIDDHIAHRFEFFVVAQLFDGAAQVKIESEVVPIQDVDVLVAIDYEQVVLLAVEELRGRAGLPPDGLLDC